ncbi:SIMPL domain-containing protein [Isosphaeraceae bacterium EP7]
MPPTITVTGIGKISAVPDIAQINVGVVTQAATAGEALAGNSSSMTKLYAILKERGVATKDLQTSQVSISPVYSQPAPHNPQAPNNEFVPRIVGYRVDNTLEITARKIEKLGELLDALVQSGANQIHGISFRVDKPEGLLDSARKQAMQDAKRKAEMLAGEAGVVVGHPRSISEGSDFQPPVPKFAGAMRMMAADSTPVAAGEQELSVTVNVVYELILPK